MIKIFKINSLIQNGLILFILLLSLGACKEKVNYALKEQELLEQYIKDSNITVEPTASGLYYIEIKEGTGEPARYGREVTVEYIGTFLDGTEFDNSYDVEKPFKFILGTGNVISGWHEGVSYMKDGGKAKIIVPSSLGYGPYGAGSIPGYTTLIFEIELTNVQ